MTTKNQQAVTKDDIGDDNKKYKVSKIFTKIGGNVFPKQRICEVVSEEGSRVIIKARVVGIISAVHVSEGDVVTVGSQVFEVEDCCHPTLMGNICCDCGKVLDEEELPQLEAVAMLHSIPSLKVTKNTARKLGDEDMHNLLKQRKLVLLVDLDQTLVHTTNDDIPPNIKDVYHFQLAKGGRWYHTRLRPFCKTFLQNISKQFELHICTFGAREYAHFIAHFLDPDQKLFGNRILSRNECLDSMSKKANLSSLFPCGDNMVVIIDDRVDVWNFAPNVVQVLPYHFFQHTGDINAPQGLQKRENDDTKGIDFSTLDLENSQLKTSDKTDSKVETTEVKMATEIKNVTAFVEGEKMEVDVGSDQIVDRDVKCDVECNIPCDGKESEEKILNDDVQLLQDVTENGNKNVSLEEKAEVLIAEEEAIVSSSQDENKLPGTDEFVASVLIDEENKVQSTTEELNVPDSDDYLLYLEDILKKLHNEFFLQYDSDGSHLPDLKLIVPSVRKRVLEGVNISFSGIVPRQVNLKESKAYYIATSYGATVMDKPVVKHNSDLPGKIYTTHLISANLRTEKVLRLKKKKNIHIVTPNWLWSCAERWERVDERLFHLKGDNECEVQRLPPSHCYSPDPVRRHLELESDKDSEESSERIPSSVEEMPSDVTRNRSPSGKSMSGEMNPLLFFSTTDRRSMDEEVEEVLSEESDSEDSHQPEKNSELEMKQSVLKEKRREEEESDDDCNESDEENDDESLHVNKKLKSHDWTDSYSVSSNGSESAVGESESSANDGNEDSVDWGKLGADLEEEFLH